MREIVSVSLVLYSEKRTLFQDESICETLSMLTHLFPVHPFSTPLKTENLMVFWCFQGVAKGCIGNGWVSPSIWQELHHLIIKSESSKLLLLYTSTNARMLHLQIAYCKLYFFFFFKFIQMRQKQMSIKILKSPAYTLVKHLHHI